ncbi:MAG: hypothetical protein IJY04_08755, partial [Clostridia bacterium]|nr:hypothetical protein [Clostridia bacterium]
GGAPGLFPDLRKMGSILIGGSDISDVHRTLNAMLAGITLGSPTEQPSRCGLVIVDCGELLTCQSCVIPHIVEGKIRDRREAVKALRQLVLEMEKRFEIMQEKGVYTADECGIPHKILVIGEITDLSPVKGTALENHLMRLLQKGRAANVYCIIATSHPRERLISRTLRANITTRIAARVEHKLESEYLIDAEDAVNLKKSGEYYIRFPWLDELKYVRG